MNKTEYNNNDITDWYSYLVGCPRQSVLSADHARSPLHTIPYAEIDLQLQAEPQSPENMHSNLVAVLYVLMQRYIQENDIVIGTTLAPHNPVYVPLRIKSDESLSFQELVSIISTHKSVLQHYSAFNLCEIVETLKIPDERSYHPLFQVALVEQHESADTLIDRLDILFIYKYTTDGLALKLRYNSDLYDKSTVQRLALQFNNLFAEGCAHPNKEISHFRLLTKDEQHQLRLWNNTHADYPVNQSIPSLFELQATKTPENIALIFDDQCITYQILNEKANQLAHYLQSLGVQKEALVAISMKRSPEMIISLLAILKAGAAYIPLDPDYPADRIEYMLEDSDAKHLITHSHVAEKYCDYTGKMIHYEREIQKIECHSKENLNIAIDPECLAYVLYTSGSTGKPKGVMGLHKGAINRFAWMWQRYPFEINEVLCQKTSLNFGDSIWEIFGPLLQGMKLVLVDDRDAKNPENLIQVIAKHRVTRLVVVPSLLHSMIEDYQDLLAGLQSLKIVVVSGEALSSQLIEAYFHHLSQVKLLNLYGSTEMSADATFYEVTKEDVGKQFIPIGKPLNNMQLYILNAKGGEIALGSIGELYVAGVGLAKGYWKKDDLTQKSFLDMQLNNETVRLYKTGDKGRFLQDGNIEYTGRADKQIKWRGYRIEINEIEWVLDNIDEIQSSVVTLNKSFPRNERLEAYIVCKKEYTTEENLFYVFEKIKRELSSKLPSYMVPTKLLFIEDFPLTPSGKINKLALPQHKKLNISQKLAYQAPRDEIETVITQIWDTLLAMNNISVYDNLYTLGANSLLLAKSRRLIQEKLGVTLSTQQIFENGTIAEMADLVKARSKTSLSLSRIRKRLVPHDAEASFAQQRMWVLNQISNQKSLYNVLYRIRCEGDLNIDALNQAFNTIVNRHGALRTNLVMNGEQNKLTQVVRPEDNFSIEFISLSDSETFAEQIESYISSFSSLEFDLARDSLFKVIVLRSLLNKHDIFILAHHAVVDGISIEIILKEFSLLYNNLPLGKMPSEYSDYALSQREYVNSKQMDSQLQFWVDHLSGIPESINLSIAKPRKSINRFSGGVSHFTVDNKVIDAIKYFCFEHKITLANGLLTTFQVLLSHYTDQEEIVIGVPVAGRQSSEVENCVGLFVNTLPIRLCCDTTSTFDVLAKNVSDTFAKAFDNQDVPFDYIVKALKLSRDASYHPVFQVMFAFEASIDRVLNLQDIHCTAEEIHNNVAKFDLTLNVIEKSNGLEFNFEYSNELFDHETIERMVGHYQVLLGQFAKNPKASINTYSIISKHEASELAKMNLDIDIGNRLSLLELFESHTFNNPLASAVDFQGQSMCYQELNNRANQLAHYLISLDIGENPFIPVCLSKSLDLIVAILAIFKVGGCYIPIDPTFPKERMNTILMEVECKIVLSMGNMANNLSGFEGKILCLDQLHDNIAAFSASKPNIKNVQESLAYIIYTSGSTGLPKGVMVKYSNMANAYYGWETVYQLESLSCHLQMANHTFDVFLGDFVRAFGSGKKLVLCEKSDLLNPEHLYHLILTHQVSFAEFVPAVLRSLMDYLSLNSKLLPPTLQYIVSGSDTWKMGDFKNLKALCAENTRLFNSYGLTECTIDSTYYEYHDAALNHYDLEKPAPLGKPFPGTGLHIIKQGQLAPMGVVGELYISGQSVAHGYFKRPKMNKERFLKPNSILNIDSTLYKTGDLVRYLPSGMIEYLGRADLQVKLRGYRIDLGEIEQCILKHSEVAECVVTLNEINNNIHLIAFVIIKDGIKGDWNEAVLAFLRERLPAYMIPTATVVINKMPLTANGKIDRKSLKAPETIFIEKDGHNSSAINATQTILLDLFKELLKSDSIGIHDNFFKMGGDSILSIQLLSRAKRKGIVFSVQEFFQGSTVAEISLVANVIEPQEIAELSHEHDEENIAFLPIQKWFLEEKWSQIHYWNQGIVLDLPKEVTFEGVTTAFIYLVNHHPQLRARFHRNETNNWIQTINKKIDPEITTSFTTTLPTEIERIANSLHADLDINDGRVIKMAFISCQPEHCNKLVIVAHHLVVDGVSWRIIADDLTYLFDQILACQQLVLPQQAISYGQWAKCVAKYAISDELKKEIPYWQHQLRNTAPSVPYDFNKGASTVATSSKLTFDLTTEMTQSLLGPALLAYNTPINDLLLAALLLSCNNSVGSNHLFLMLEGHGREDLGNVLDVSRTVGWFTSEFPVYLEATSDQFSNIATCIKSVKEQLKTMPKKGIGYGIIKYLSDNPCLQNADIDEPTMSFNYLGQFDSSSLSVGQCFSDKNARKYDLEVEGQIINKQLVVEITYCQNRYDHKTIQLLSENFKNCLIEVIQHCSSAKNFGFTVSDFPLVKISLQSKIVDLYPLSPMQKGLLSRHYYKDENQEYQVQSLYRLQGNWSESALYSAWEHLMQRFPILRTGIYEGGLDDEPLQYVLAAQTLPWKKLARCDLNALFEQDRRSCFDLKSPPYFRCYLIELAENDYYFLLSHHHILLDGWSTSVLFDSLFDIYEKIILNKEISPTINHGYRNYIKSLSRAEHSQSREFWQNYLNQSSPCLLKSVDYHKLEASENLFMSDIEVKCSHYLESCIKGFETQHGLTSSSLFQAILSIVIGQTLQIDDVSYGVVVSGRTNTDVESVETVVGLLANTLPLRVDLAGASTFVRLAHDIQLKTRDISLHSGLSLSDIYSASGYNSEFPLFDVLFVCENFPEYSNAYLQLNNLVLSEVRTEERSEFPLSVIVSYGDYISIKFVYDPKKISTNLVQSLAKSFQNVMQTIALFPDININKISLLQPSDYQRVIREWNNTETTLTLDKTVIQLFEQQVSQTPDNIALILDNTQMTYATLNNKANQLAHYLRSVGVKTNDLVALSMERSIDLIVGVLGILKSGAAYVPIDANYPQLRMDYIVSDCKPKVILRQTSHFDQYPEDNPTVVNHNQDLAYIIYTSGSTGKPKGVMVEHGGLLNLALAQIKDFSIDSQTRLLQFASISFDAAVSEIMTTLMTGATLVMVPSGQLPSGEILEDLLIKHNVSVVTLPPSILATLNTIGSLKTLVVAGEAPSKKILDRWKGLVKIINAYGPTEITVCATSATYDVDAPASRIGRPIQNAKVYVLGRNLMPVPIGVPGECYIGGAGVARGYLNQPELTQDRFFVNPFATPRELQLGLNRLYRTGDLVRYLPDGQLDYLGRLDHQVKIRGFRVELGEIENVLRQSQFIKDVVVVVADREGNQRLVAYIVLQPTITDLTVYDGSEQLQNYVSNKLPNYMLPSTYIFMDKLPLNSNGKVDRKLLPAPQESAFCYEVENQRKMKLRSIWNRLLGLTSFDNHTSFFRLGGNSLLAVKLRASIREDFDVNVNVSDIFNHATLSQMSKLIDERKLTTTITAVNSIKKSVVANKYPLSFSQRRFWFLDKISDQSAAFNVPLVYELQGELNINALQKALDALITRHDQLRMRFYADDDGIASQEVMRDFSFAIEILNLNDSDSVMQRVNEEAARPFDISKASLRAVLLRHSITESILMLTLHHIICDEMSSAVINNELSAFYNAFCTNSEVELPSLPLSYGDYTFYQYEEAKSDRYNKQLQYWLERFAVIPDPIELPYDFSRLAHKNYLGASVSTSVSAELTMRLKMMAEQQQVTLFMILLACFDVLLYRYSGENSIVVGTPCSGRHFSELENLIGCFVNTLAIKVDMDDHHSFIEVLKKVKESTMGAYDNQDVPFEEILSQLNIPYDTNISPLFQVMFVMNSNLDKSLQMQGLDTKEIELQTKTSKYDLVLYAQGQENTSLLLNFEYDSNLFTPSTMKRMADHFIELLSHILSDPHKDIAYIQYLTQPELNKFQQMMHYESESMLSQNTTLVSLFQNQVVKYPTKIAVTYEDESLTYEELNQQANKVAHYLIERGVKPDMLVCLCVDRSIDMMVLILAILKAGGAYVPIDPTYPQHRINYILNDTRATILLTQDKLRAQFKEHLNIVITIDKLNDEVATKSSANPEAISNSASLAYVIYTSGSTGNPKGVLITHFNVCRLFSKTQDYYGFNENDHWSLFHSYAFDFSVWEMWGALLYGGRLAIVPYLVSRSPELFYEFLIKHEITVLNQTPSAFGQLITHDALKAQDNLHLRYVIFGGEALSPLMLSPWFNRHGDSKPKIINMYGITETTVHVTYCEITAETLAKKQGSVIGKQIEDLCLIILDRNRQPVAIGVKGELYVGGAGLANGYLNQPQLTADRFIDQPIHQNSRVGRWYRTGDLARHLTDGNIEYLGRLDQQVKLRGFRIELGEIESAIRELNLVKEVAVVVMGNNEHKQLVAYMVSQDKISHHVEQLLMKKLPNYMIPSAYVLMDKLPLTVNGKLDRKLLPIPTYSSSEQGTVAPRTARETALWSIWSDILANDNVGIYDDFFKLGGNSILAAQVISKSLKNGINISLGDLFQYRSIVELAKLADQRMSEVSALSLEFSDYLDDEALYPLSKMQEIMVLNYGPGVYHSQISYHCENNEFSMPAFKAALEYVINRHPAFRIRFVATDKGYMQRIQTKINYDLYERNLSGLSSAEQRKIIVAHHLADRKSCFDVNDPAANLFRVALFQLNEKQFEFFISLHHAIEDGWGIVEFLKDLFNTYLFNKSGTPINLVKAKNVHRWYVEYENKLSLSEKHISFWQKHISRLAPHSLEPIPAVDCDNVALDKLLDTTLRDQLFILGKQLKVNIKAVFLSALFDTISKLTNDPFKTIGVISNGGRLAEIPESFNALGLFWTLLPVSIKVIDDKNEQIKLLQGDLCELETHATFPVNQIMENNNLQNVYFATFNFISFHNEKDLPCEVKILSITGHDKFHHPLNVTVSFDSLNNALEIRIDYDNKYFNQESASTILDDFVNNLNALINTDFIKENEPVNTKVSSALNDLSIWSKKYVRKSDAIYQENNFITVRRYDE